MSSALLCDYCKVIVNWLGHGISDSSAIKHERQDYYPDFPALAASATSGCQVCGMLRHGIQHKFEQLGTPTRFDVSACDKVVFISHVAFFPENFFVKVEVPEPRYGPFRLVFDLSAPGIYAHEVRVAFDIYADEGIVLVSAPNQTMVTLAADNLAATEGKIQRRLPSLEPLSSKNIQTVKGLIHECLEHHPGCRLDGPISLPRRLIDVNTGDERQARLVETEQLSSTPLYAALSHTWGRMSTSGSFLTTELSSMQDRLRGIALSTMPQNFQDTVKVARALGVRYIWIDSLCIIQDSESDWAMESSRMDQVYANAYVTIVATSAASAHDGFLERLPPLYPPAKIPYFSADHGRSPGFFYLSPRYTHWVVNDHDDLIEETVWNSRGWTLQERILSKRVLHFTKNLLYFECRAEDWMEDDRPPGSSINRTPWLGADDTGFQRGQLNTQSDKSIIYRSWYDLVRRYSRRNLTKADDKLPALAGLAHQVSKLINDQYLAGLWKNDLRRGLVWRTVHYGKTKKCEIYRAPSWSWAQFDGDIHFEIPLFLDKVRYYFDVLEAEVKETNEGCMGRLTFGWLKLKGCLESISWIRGKGLESPGSLFSYEIFSEAGRVGEGHLDQPGISMTGPGLFAFLLYLDLSNEGGNWYMAPVCLLLEATGKNPNEYRRIGTMHILKGGGDRGPPGRLDFFDTSVPRIITIV